MEKINQNYKQSLPLKIITMSIDIKSILSELERKIEVLAKTTMKDSSSQGTNDGKQLLITIKSDLVSWTQELADGELTKSDFETLLLGQKDLIEMNKLKESGLSLARINEFKDHVFSLIVDTVTNLV